VLAHKHTSSSLVVDIQSQTVEEIICYAVSSIIGISVHLITCIIDLLWIIMVGHCRYIYRKLLVHAWYMTNWRNMSGSLNSMRTVRAG